MRRAFCLLSLFFVAGLPVAQAQAPATAADPIPAALRDWRGWVLKDQEFRSCPLLANADFTPAHQRLAEHEDARRPRPLVLVIDAPRPRLRRRERHALLLQHLHRLLVHAQHRLPRIVGLGVGFEHFLHSSHELGVLLGRNHPVLDLPFRHAIFLSTLRTVS